MQVPKVNRENIGDDERGATGGTPVRITSCSLSISSRLASIGPYQGNGGWEEQRKLKGKMTWLKIKLKKER